MHFRGGGDKRIPWLDRVTQTLAPGDETSTSICDFEAYWQNPTCKSAAQILPQPGLKNLVPLAGRESFNAIAKLGDGNHADISLVFVEPGQPGHHSTIWAGFHRLGDDVRVQQILHSSTLRRRMVSFLGFRPKRRIGDAVRNSAKLPFRVAFRSHSSAATTTAVVRPCLVIF